MSFPDRLMLAHGPVVEDLSQARPVGGYLACFGRARGLPGLAGLDDLTTLWVSGVNAAQWSHITACSRLHTLIIHELRVSDLGGIEQLRQLHTLLVAGNTKCQDLEPLSRLPSLRSVGLEHFPKVRSLEPLGQLTGLQQLSLEGSMEKAMKVDSLTPLAALRGLRQLRLLHLLVGDRSLEPLTRLSNLEELNLANMFPRAEVARLAALLLGTRCALFAGEISFNRPCARCGASKIMLVQERLAVCCPQCEASLLARHRRAFQAEVESFGIQATRTT